MRSLPLFVILAACGSSAPTLSNDSPSFGSTDKAFTSAVATLLTFDFDVEFLSASAPWNATQAAQDYLLYTMGHLNADDAVGRLDKVTLSAMRNTPVADGLVKTSFHVSMPVAWGRKASLPTRYAFTLPKRGDWQGLQSFATKYATSCIDSGAHDVTSGNMWYYYRPRATACKLASEDVLQVSATVSVSTENTTGKYPEFHKVWEDNQLSVIAIFGKYEDGATNATDAGISAFNQFTALMRRDLGAGVVETATTPNDVTLKLALADGRSVTITTLLVNSVLNAGANFDLRYNTLSAEADVIAYHGHAGLGSNVRALVRKGSFIAGKYQIFFMNGCDTFAYVDGALAQQKAALNPDDPSSTKYLDMLTNAMPAYFSSMPGAMAALLRGLRAYSAPTTYEQMFRGVDKSQVIVATGEEDNVYFPGFTEDTQPLPFAGFSVQASLTAQEEWVYQTPVLAPGTYTFSIAGSGDADLYVRSAQAPTLTDWDCRPYAGTSEESCVVNVTAPTTVNVAVRGYASKSVINFTAR